MNRKDWRTVSADDIAFEPRELRNQLVPTLLTTDSALRERIAAQPMLAWKSLHVGRYRDDK